MSIFMKVPTHPDEHKIDLLCIQIGLFPQCFKSNNWRGNVWAKSAKLHVAPIQPQESTNLL